MAVDLGAPTLHTSQPSTGSSCSAASPGRGKPGTLHQRKQPRLSDLLGYCSEQTTPEQM